MERECRDMQQNLYENLGDREYDCFQLTEEKYLKLKIAYSLFGPPNNENVFNPNEECAAEQYYNTKQNKIIEDYLKLIKKYSVYSEDPPLIYVSFLFNCLLYNNKIRYYPIFRVRRCFGSPTGNNCCEFIDEHLRVYKNWADYLKNNKLPKGLMIVPKDGKYMGNNSNKVLLDSLNSPALSVKEDIKTVGDVTSTVASLVSGSIAIASLIPAITVAPIVLTGALLTGAGVGVYSVARSSIELVDRKAHKQSISLKNNQARNCYLNIAAGTTSVLTTGTTKVASFALNRGVIIGETAASALLSVNAVNMAVNGCNVANSLYKVISDFKNKKNPSAIDIMHLTTSVLFFGNAVVNLKSACVIYKESQSKSFSELVKIRSQDLWNRAKERFFNADVTTYENNSSLKNINDSGDYCQSLLTTGLKERCIETCRQVTINMLKELIFNINLEEVIEAGKYLIENKENVYAMCIIILNRFDNKMKQILLKLVNYLIKNVIKEAFEPMTKIFSKTEKVVIFLNIVINFLKFKVAELEIEYQSKKADTLRLHHISEDEYNSTCESFKNAGERMGNFFILRASRMVSLRGIPEEIPCKEMIDFFWVWLLKKQKEYVPSVPGRKINYTYLRNKAKCANCRGYYYLP